ncbi:MULTISPECIES: HGxxPAAW family protein [unclassified Nocardioides]|uniref:HGxxPAAW family protein n=1 Tax=unclassified Nocardioides TaxID=2615069 RepID=UPI00360E79E6
MSANHGNTPAAWTFVAIAMLGFVVGAAGMLFSPINWTIFWIGAALAVASLIVFPIMVRLGFHESDH